MFDTANQTVIFVPMLVIVALTFVAFIRMAVARGAIAKQMDMNFYRGTTATCSSCRCCSTPPA